MFEESPLNESVQPHNLVGNSLSPQSVPGTIAEPPAATMTPEARFELASLIGNRRHATKDLPMRGHDDQFTCSLKEEGRHASRGVLRAAAKPAGDSSAAPDNTNDTRYDNLAKAIHQRIASRAQGRIHDLNVCIQEQTVVLSGHCATYYSKQLAQHAAQGIIENEHLENEIHVVVPR